jgi:hypothetical protein
MVLRAVPDYFLWPVFVRDTLAGRILVVVVSAVVLMGIVRQARRQEWKPIQLVLPFYIGVALLWLFPDVYRFFVLFLPLFAAGLWCEAKFILGMARAEFAKPHNVFGKFISASAGVLVIALTCAVFVNYWGGSRTIIEEKSWQRGAILDEKREAYDWISSHTASDSRIIAYEDAIMYLYTGRQSVRPIAFSTTDYYEPGRIFATLDHITDVARAVGAEYWVVADDDFSAEWPAATFQARGRVSELEKVLPLRFRSRNGRVRVYGLECIRNPQQADCRQADLVLFPFPAD